MTTGAENRLVRLRSEIRNAKQAPTLGYPKTLLPANTPKASRSTTIIHDGYGSSVMARWRARFTRTDGIDRPPLVQFPFTVSFSPTYARYQADELDNYGEDSSGYVERQCYDGYVAGAGSNYVDFYIVINGKVADYWELPPPVQTDPDLPPVQEVTEVRISVSVEVQALATVPGTLSLEAI